MLGYNKKHFVKPYRSTVKFKILENKYFIIILYAVLNVCILYMFYARYHIFVIYGMKKFLEKIIRLIYFLNAFSTDIASCKGHISNV